VKTRKHKVSAYTFCNNENTPDSSTIYHWKTQSKALFRDLATIPMLGHPLKLSVVERYIVRGWVIEQDYQYLITSGDTICSFIAKSFYKTVSPAWVTRTMQALYLSSHQEAIKKEKCDILISQGHTSNILSQKVYTSYYLDTIFHIEKTNKCKHCY